jgi:tRNA (guanine37-N1)-methyltransferase
VRFSVISIFPEIFDSFLKTSLVGKAVEAGRVQVELVDPRDFTHDRHRSTDDTPYGGGDGMVMKPEPLAEALESLEGQPYKIMLTPQGEPLSQALLQELSGKERVALVCGRYEGFDERVRGLVDREVSLGDFVLNGGEVAAMALIDGVARLVPGTVGNAGSLQSESHNEGLLEYPQYTRPPAFRGQEVPEVLLSGDHARIQRWRRRQMLLRTRERRPDLWRRLQPQLSAEDREILGADDDQGTIAARSYIALLHHPVHDRTGAIVTTAITNLDIHDIARSSRTYGLAGYFVVTPLTSQQQLADRIAEHWRTGHGAVYNPRRREALVLLRVTSDLEQTIERITDLEGKRPLVVVTSAASRPGQLPPAEVLAAAVRADAPLLLVLGTGWGLAPAALEAADLAMTPVWGPTPYNHLSVRSAASILLDRCFGLRD